MSDGDAELESQCCATCHNQPDLDNAPDDLETSTECMFKGHHYLSVTHLFCRGAVRAEMAKQYLSLSLSSTWQCFTIWCPNPKEISEIADSRRAPAAQPHDGESVPPGGSPEAGGGDGGVR